MEVLTSSYSDDEKDICDEIRAWSSHALEKQNPYFAGLPACPYAKAAWQNNRVHILFKRGGDEFLADHLKNFDDSFDLIIVANQDEDKSSEALHDYLDRVNVEIANNLFGQRDLWVMGFHPNDGRNDFVDHGTFEPITNTCYSMIFVQRLSKIQEAADKLKELGYYDQYLEEYDAAELFEKRAAFYRRMKDGDESS
jgi:hypothetical protein